MANGKVHRAVGTVTGAGVSLYRSRFQKPQDRLVEGIGGAFAGYLGGQLPDILEPAISSWHRGRAHSALAGVTIGTATVKALETYQAWCRERAEYYRMRRLSLEGSSGWYLLYYAAELFYRLAAGALAGFTGGYVSHLALDAFTPRSIPVC